MNINPMPAITILQPYTSLLAYLFKLYETRGWVTRYRGPIAIHAGKRLIDRMDRETVDAMRAVLFPDKSVHDDFFLRCENELPFGVVIATAELVDCRPTEGFILGGTLCKLSHNELLFGDWTPGRFAWEFANMRLLPEPIPARGKQGLWTWEGVAV